MTTSGAVVAGIMTLATIAGVGTGVLDTGKSGQAYLVPYGGWYNYNDSVSDNHAAQFGLEYRFAEWKYGLRPTLGANVTSKGALYGYGGLNWDVKLIDKLLLTPNFMVGAFERGNGKSLGGVVEFRSGIELSYEFANRHRIGAAFNHISNADIYSYNPGAETLLINYAIPLGGAK